MDNYTVAALLLFALMVPAILTLIVENLFKDEELEQEIEARNKAYHQAQRQDRVNQIKTLNNCVIEVVYLDDWEYIQYRKKFKNAPSEITLEL